MDSKRSKILAKKNRLAILFDGHKWFVRRVRVIEYDLTNNEKVYRCDHPIGSSFDNLSKASIAALEYLHEYD